MNEIKSPIEEIISDIEIVKRDLTESAKMPETYFGMPEILIDKLTEIQRKLGKLSIEMAIEQL